jgi:hypothetical protein
MLTVFFVAKVDNKLRSDTTKHSATLDASGIEKHIGNTCGTKGLVNPTICVLTFLILQK